MKKKIFVFALLILCIQGVHADELKQLQKNLDEMTLQQKVDTRSLINEFITLSDTGKNNDAMLLQLYFEVTIPDEQVAQYLRSQLPDGSWSDIDYKDKKRSQWSPTNHVARIHSLTKVYCTPSSSYYHSKELDSKIHRAMKYWFDTKPKCTNWWYNQIGIPRIFGPVFLLLKDELSKDEWVGAMEVMDEAKIRMTGQNKVWLAGNVFMKALLSNNLQLAMQARDSIVSEIYLTTREGMQADYSFHQHGPQLQLGNYGLAYISSMSYWARVFSNTSFAINPKQLDYLRNYVLRGMQWVTWKGYFDINACGRQVFKDTQKGKADALDVAVINMAKLDLDRAAPRAAYGRFIYENFSNVNAPNTLIGNQYFWRSDYMVHRTVDWYASVRMQSKRIRGYEMTNGENRQGYYSSDGISLYYVKGDEYNNLFPYWDWKHLPGLTAADHGLPLQQKYLENSSDFVGGVSDGKHGATAMILNRDGLHAWKSSFFFDRMIVNLGAGIHSNGDDPVSTSMDQCKWTSAIDSSTVVATPWIHHGTMGYYLFQKEALNISTQMQYGAWDSIAPFYINQADSGKVFKAVIEHGVHPQNASYAYAVMPNSSLNELKSFVGHPTVAILRNDTLCQAVSLSDHSLVYIVFYKAGELDLHNGQRISSNEPCMVIISYSKDLQYISVSDPTQELDTITLKIPQTLNFHFSKELGLRGQTKTMKIKTNKDRYENTIKSLCSQ